MNKSYEYMQDLDFLFKINSLNLKEQYVKIIALDWNERPITEIQGSATSGNISLDGKAAMRRTCSLGMQIPHENYSHVTDVNNLFSINRKIFIELGIKNTTNEYCEYPIIWFPMGTYIIINPSLNHSASGLNLSLQLRDKMSLLNGDCGGTFPATVQFDEYETYDEYGNLVVDRPVISQIIREAVNHWGEEQLGKIIISDVPDRIKQVMKWTGSTPLYFKNTRGDYLLTTNYDAVKDYAYHTYEYGDDVGYIFTDFTYPGELIENAGSNVVTILDKIKNTLGNYEYYYDVYGNFIWQEIKNYLNTTQATVDLEKLKENNYSLARVDLNNIQNEDYLLDMTKGKSLFDFKDSKLIASYSNSPQFNNIKNDYIVWGTRESSSGTAIPIRFHLAIDNKPEIGTIRYIFMLEDETDGLIKPQVATPFDNKESFPTEGQVLVYYLDKSTNLIYRWEPPQTNEEQGQYVQLGGNYKIESYTSINDFPEQGELETIYVDLSTKNKYEWGTDETSEHYLAVQELKRQAQSEAKADIETLETEKQTLLNNLSIAEVSENEIQQEIKDLTATQATKDRDAQNKQKALIALQEQYETESDLLVTMENATIAAVESVNGSYPYEDTIGQYGKGNIDLYNRPRIENEDGSFMTVESMSFHDEEPSSYTFGKEVLVTTVTSNGSLTDSEAIARYYSTGEYLGIFNTPDEATAYAIELHNQQQVLYTLVEYETGNGTQTVLEMEQVIIPAQRSKVDNLILQVNKAADLYENAQNAQTENQALLAAKQEQLISVQTDIENLETEISQKNQEIESIEQSLAARIEELLEEEKEYVLTTTVTIDQVQSTDWRTELYLQGVEASRLGLESNYYYAELAAEWPKIYDIKKESYTNEAGETVYTGGFLDDVLKHPDSLDYWLDFIDTDSKMGLFNVNNIGRRSLVENNDEVNCIFECHIPDLVIINKDDENADALRDECVERGQGYTQVDPAVYDMLAIGGSQRSAFEEIKNLLFEHTSYNESIQLNTIPLYHLEPNTRISVIDPDSDIYGDYMINTISLPLDISGTSSIGAVRPIEKM